MRFRNKLVLTEYIYSLFNQDSFEGFHKELKDKNEGFGPTGHSKFYEALIGMNPQISRKKLREYDRNIQGYEKRLNKHRDTEIKLKYFQYLSLLFTEIYLDKYFNKRKKLLRDFRSFVREKNKELPDKENHFEPTEEDLRKLAYWIATGGGKTLIMHANLWQFRRYNNENLDVVLLITPNEGMTQQHIEEMEKSGISAEGVRGDKIDNLFSPGIVSVTDIHKLKPKGEEGKKTIPTDIFEEGNNLIFVDEGHKGSSGTEWRERRGEVVSEGFVFEYSATFGQAFNNVGNRELIDDYAKSIICYYPFKYFHKDGYGKSYNILNLSEEKIGAEKTRFMTANLLSFFEQKLYYQNESWALSDYNIESPLWIFVGRTVSSRSKTAEFQERTTDVLRIVKFLKTFLDNREKMENFIRNVLEEKDPFVDKEGRPVFEDRFDYAKNVFSNSNEVNSSKVYDRILSTVFNTETNSGLELVNLENAEGEIALRVDDNDYFAVIDIGNASKLLSRAEEDIPGVTQEEDQFTSSLFNQISDRNNLNILIGAKKFMEGWDTWRVSNMGLMNVGQKEGPQIMQLFGRGVRLLGKNQSLKRSEGLESNQHPDHISLLETLNIFAIRSRYMENFEKYLQKEDILQKKHKERGVDVRTNEEFLREDLKVPRVTAGKQFSTSENLKLRVEDISPIVNMYLEITEWGNGSAEERPEKTVERTLDAQLIPLLNWDQIYFDVIDYKKKKRYHNLYISKEILKEIIKEGRFLLKCPQEYISLDNWTDLNRIQNIVLGILKSYMEEFYDKKKTQWENNHRNYIDLRSDETLIPEDYKLSAPEEKEKLVKEIERLAENQEELFKPSSSRDPTEDFPTVYYRRHIWQPLFVKQELKEEEGTWIKTIPTALNQGEAKLVRELEALSEREVFPKVNMFLMRNRSGKGIGFSEAGYPDFILWLKQNNGQDIIFLDPHSLFPRGLEDPKIKLYKKVKAIEKKLEGNNIHLHSFVIPGTVEDMKEETTKEEYHRQNIFFADEEDYMRKTIEKVLDPNRRVKAPIEDRIEGGENENTEFKETLLCDVRRNKKSKGLKFEYAKEICAFANSEGGQLIIGVDDDGEIKGLKRDFQYVSDEAEFKKKILDVVKGKIGKGFAKENIIIDFRELKGNKICVVDVEPTSTPTYFGNDEFFVRIGSSKETLSTKEKDKYIERNSQKFG